MLIIGKIVYSGYPSLASNYQLKVNKIVASPHRCLHLKNWKTHLRKDQITPKGYLKTKICMYFHIKIFPFLKFSSKITMYSK